MKNKHPLTSRTMVSTKRKSSCAQIFEGEACPKFPTMSTAPLNLARGEIYHLSKFSCTLLASQVVDGAAQACQVVNPGGGGLGSPSILNCLHWSESPLAGVCWDTGANTSNGRHASSLPFRTWTGTSEFHLCMLYLYSNHQCYY